MKKPLRVGVDLGGTNIKIGCFDENQNLINKTMVPTPIEDGPQGIVDKIYLTVVSLAAEKGFSALDVGAVGIGSPGVMDLEVGVVIAAANMRFRNVPLRELLEEKFKCPVVLENDANVTAWGEYTAGAGKGVKDMVLVTLGTGIGGGIISNGQLVHGFANKAAEIGHMIIQPAGRACACGQKGCIEAYSSANAVAARAAEAIEAGADSSLKEILETKGKITCKDVYEHSDNGDELARKITDETAWYLAVLCVDLLHLTGPKRIIFYGGMTNAGDSLLLPIREYFQQLIWTVQEEKDLEICLATLGEDAGIIGSSALASHTFRDRL